jgi:type II secretion system protein L
MDWALVDAAGACVESGRARPAALPRAERLEVIVAAARVRIASVALPPMTAARAAAAARFALEDHLAGPPQAQHLAVSAPGMDGHVRVVIVDRALLDSVAGADGPLARADSVVAEPDLALVAAGWRWCVARDGSGFVRRADGSAFAVDAPAGSDALPVDLVLALEQARRNGAAPAEVRVDGPFDAALVARWQRDAGVPFRVGAPWLWYAAPAPVPAAATDLRIVAEARAQRTTARQRVRLLAPALWIAGAALALHVIATVAEWAALELAARRDDRAQAALATGAGVAPDAAGSPPAAHAALVRRHAELRHAHGLSAPGDALPLLARAAPALAALPAGAVKRATYADAHWTLDLAPADAATLAQVDARLRDAAVPALTATGPSGTRIRLGRP